MKVLVESYGCTMNHGEARQAAASLRDRGIHVILGQGSSPTSNERVDVTLLFTCDVISSTERRMWRRMERALSAGSKLAVGGCLGAISGPEIERRFPGALVLDTMGTDRIEEAMDVFTGWLNESKRVAEDGGRSTENGGSVLKPEKGRIDNIVPISTGCLGNCSYCITRLARGRLRSVEPRYVVESIKSGLGIGLKEVLLTSQDTGIYGLDGTSSQTNEAMETGHQNTDVILGGDVFDLGDLLKLITEKVVGRYGIRVGMMNPHMKDSILDSILDGYTDPRVFRFFHLPVQSGSDRVLGSMGRRYDVRSFLSVMDMVRKRYPDASISTDIIVGFPGETELEFRQSLELVSKVGPDILNITRFSSRPGTRANEMEGLHSSVLKERSRALTKLHADLAEKKLKKRLGYHEGCLVTEVGKPETMMARDVNYTPIVVRGGSELLGDFVDIETRDVGPTYLIGDVIERSVTE